MASLYIHMINMSIIYCTIIVCQICVKCLWPTLKSWSPVLHIKWSILLLFSRLLWRPFGDLLTTRLFWQFLKILQQPLATVCKAKKQRQWVLCATSFFVINWRFLKKNKQNKNTETSYVIKCHHHKNVWQHQGKHIQDKTEKENCIISKIYILYNLHSYWSIGYKYLLLFLPR